MGKKKTKKHEPTKAERKALKAREAELRAELERRAAKKAAKKKAGKKAKKAKAERPEPVEMVDAAALGVMTIEAEAHVAGDPDPEPPVESAEAVAERAKPLKGKKLKAAMKADTDAAAARAAEIAAHDAELKAKVQAKRAAREAAAAEKPGSPERLAKMQDDVAEQRKKRAKAAKAPSEAEVVEKVGAAVDALRQATEAVETERGRVFETGASVAAEADIAVPSDGARADFEVNGNGQYRVKRPSDGKMVGYTRVTTYIACLEDTTKLTEWKMRILLEGVAAAEEHADREGVTAKIRELAHVRDVAIAKARKADKKGKLDVGDLAVLIERAWSDFKKALDVVADELFELGGGREKATKGTDIHGLTEIHDREGIDRVGEMLTDGEITPADMADVEAYAEAMRKLGAKIVESERVVVNDELKVAGRLDRVVMVKLPALHDPKTGEVIRPAEARARRRVLDIKTGRIDYSTGKLAQQLEMYAGATGYDLETHEREDLKLDRTVGLVLHLPAGSGKATVHVVDLVAGRKGNRLAGEVRAWRNEGKRAARLDVDVLAEIEKATDADVLS